MPPSERLARPTRCRRCGVEIPSGTLLSALDWDRGERAWAHRKPSCAEVGEAAPNLAMGSPAAQEPIPGSRPPAAAGSEAASQRSLTEPSQTGAWSVTLEVHEAVDPAQSKRVLRIARLHLGTLADAQQVAEQLQKEL
jgi:hypothetical protein